MKATLTGLAVLLVSTYALNPASAQAPDPYQQYYGVMAAGYGYPGYGYPGPGPVGPGPGEYTANYGGGCASGHCGGGCGAGGCGGGCALGGKLGEWCQWLKCAGCPGCPHPVHQKKECALCAKCKGWLCRPCPSDAPVCRRAEYPLGFPNHPYVRSPRDYFMWNDP